MGATLSNSSSEEKAATSRKSSSSISESLKASKTYCASSTPSDFEVVIFNAPSLTGMKSASLS